MKLLNKTQCLCGKELKAEKFDTYTPQKASGSFYGGRIGMTGTYKCKCGRELKGYFGVTPTLNLIDLGVIKDIDQAEKIDSEPISQAILEENTEKDEETVEVDPDEIDFDKMTYKEVQEIAKANGIEKVNKKKDELIKLIKEAATK